LANIRGFQYKVTQKRRFRTVGSMSRANGGPLTESHESTMTRGASPPATCTAAVAAGRAGGFVCMMRNARASCCVWRGFAQSSTTPKKTGQILGVFPMFVPSLSW
jgi:hypothetical protein